MKNRNRIDVFDYYVIFYFYHHKDIKALNTSGSKYIWPFSSYRFIILVITMYI